MVVKAQPALRSSPILTGRRFPGLAHPKEAQRRHPPGIHPPRNRRTGLSSLAGRTGVWQAGRRGSRAGGLGVPAPAYVIRGRNDTSPADWGVHPIHRSGAETMQNQRPELAHCEEHQCPAAVPSTPMQVVRRDHSPFDGGALDTTGAPLGPAYDNATPQPHSWSVTFRQGAWVVCGKSRSTIHSSVCASFSAFPLHNLTFAWPAHSSPVSNRSRTVGKHPDCRLCSSFLPIRHAPSVRHQTLPALVRLFERDCFRC